MPTIPANIPAGLSAQWVEQPVPRNVTDPQTFRAARGFEAHFAQYMVKQMQGSSKLIGGEGLGGDIYNSIFTEVLGDQIAGKGALGITDLIYRQLMQQKGVEPYSENNPAPQSGGEGIDYQPQLYQQPTQQLRAIMSDSFDRPVSEFKTMASEAAYRHGVSERLVHAVIRAESNWDSTSVSNTGAGGLMQLMPDTAAELGVTSVFDPQQNIDGGVRYLRQMLDRYEGDLPTALAAYNAGPGAVDEHNGIPPFEETQEYVQKIMSWLSVSNPADPLLRSAQTTQQAREFMNTTQDTPPDPAAAEHQSTEEEPWKRS